MKRCILPSAKQRYLSAFIIPRRIDFSSTLMILASSVAWVADSVG